MHHPKTSLLHNNHNPDPLYNVHAPQNAMYNNLHDYAPTMDPKMQAQPPGKINGFLPPGNYRTTTAFSAFSNPRPRQPNPPFRDNSASVFHTYPTDVFGPAPPSLTHPRPANMFDNLHQSRNLDFHANGPQANGNLGSHGKQPYPVDSYNPTPYHVGKQPMPPPHNNYPSQGPYHNNYHISQTPYGPHIPANNPLNGAQTGGGPPGLVHANGSGPPGSANEEISTIFVVGFPDDMQEREFQNMFTFSPGFEAATLKIPNKEYTSYNSGMSGPSRGYGQNYGSNDPYNLVTVNQGGVVVDGGRDGTTASWPATVPDDRDGSHFSGGPPPSATVPMNMPPRKQIIGFAKFRTRSDALEARDVLQGRRIDIEKGAVLKAEMAKKNLHTKRGVGPLPATVPNSASMGTGGVMAGGEPSIGGTFSGGPQVPPASNVEGAVNRERDFSTIGQMNAWRESVNRDEEDRDRRQGETTMINSLRIGAATTRGPRERVEEEERERRLKEKDARLRPANPSAFDAFHSVPASMSRTNSNTALGVRSPPASLENGGSGISPLLAHVNAYGSQQEDGVSVGPWDALTNGATARVQNAATLPLRPPSSNSQSSPPNTNPSLSPPSHSHTQLPQTHPQPQPNAPARPARTSPSSEQQQPGDKAASQPPSSACSVDGAFQNAVGEVTKTVKALAVSTSQGSTSPQLPSPASGGSSGGRPNAVDQNPPINTLYVGNLPTSMPPGYPSNYLEDSLKELFSQRPGYRKLCFRQKANGPMCFVEFEDVSFATKSLNELYGNTLNGLIKGGGIRLSYSKNPLGVRTPTSAGTGPSLQQQQQMGNGLAHFASDFFNTRAGYDGPPGLRSPTQPASLQMYMGSPPPRFISPTPSTGAFSPRGGHAPFGLPSMTSSTFSPFGMSTPPLTASILPEQAGSEPPADQSSLSHPLSPSTSTS